MLIKLNEYGFTQASSLMLLYDLAANSSSCANTLNNKDENDDLDKNGDIDDDGEGDGETNASNFYEN